MSDTQYTADELRNIASSDFLPAYASHNTDAIRAMLRAGEKAMRDLAAARARVKELEDALKPFAVFAERARLKPMRGLDDVFYAIHSGEPEREAELRFSDCDKAAAALQVKS